MNIIIQVINQFTYIVEAINSNVNASQLASINIKHNNG